ncbi:hypothetical protein DFH07DRAFT_789030 [Mycena maculata]|uniref:EamA domain-containing protein n=1 Tax=Mycena maculata TaxID=230809 RepID=A0AAD7KE59_9AGAR|nr:hypothetical protein DFH07DRAFT_789030 [Mycena maculata]
MSINNVPTPKVSTRWSFAIFACTLGAFVVESQLTQYLQTNLGYRQPFFTFYLVHSAFAVIFPVHLLYLTLTNKNYTVSSLCNGLTIALANHLAPHQTSRPVTSTFPRYKFLRLVLALTVGITYPGLLWFCAISLASVSDVTAIWNTNAFFAYLMTFRFKWEPRKLFAVSLATVGVLVVVYGGSTSSSAEGSGSVEKRVGLKPSAPLIGDLLTLVASLGYALYQVLYKKYAALPSDPELVAEAAYEHLPASDDSPNVQFDDALSAALDLDDAIYPPPFGLHPNLLTSAIGMCTLSMLWVFIPVLHIMDIEPFRLPGNLAVTSTIVGIALSGVVFNAGFMVLLGTWGPIIVSVGNLLTIVLVFVSDIVFGAGLEAVTAGGVIGCSVIVAAFGVLVYDMLDKKRHSRPINVG